MVVNQRVCTLQERCSMTPFLETGSVVRALDTLEVMALDKSVTLKHQEYLYRLFTLCM